MASDPVVSVFLLFLLCLTLVAVHSGHHFHPRTEISPLFVLGFEKKLVKLGKTRSEIDSEPSSDSICLVRLKLQTTRLFLGLRLVPITTSATTYDDVKLMATVSRSKIDSDTFGSEI